MSESAGSSKPAAPVLPFTGERFTPECVREIWYEHMHRYALAAGLSADRRVLDAACGEGYGTALLASRALSVVGADMSPETVAHARERYGGLAGLTFKVADCTRLPFEDASFDLVVSFETLEHLAAQDEMLREFRRVLDPQGCLLISSPDKAVYTEQLGNENEFHVRELYRHEFEALLGRHFPQHRLLGQKLAFHSVIYDVEGQNTVRFQHWSAADGRLTEPSGIPQAPVYLLALCASHEEALLTPPADLCLFDDAEESVYSDYYAEIRRNMAARGVIEARDREVEALRRRIAELEAQQPGQEQEQEPEQDPGQASGRPWYRRLLGLD